MRMNWKGTLVAVSVALVLGGAASAQSVVQLTDENGFFLNNPVIRANMLPNQSRSITVYVEPSALAQLGLQSMMPAAQGAVQGEMAEDATATTEAQGAAPEGAAATGTPAAGAAAAAAPTTPASPNATAPGTEVAQDQSDAAQTAMQDMNLAEMFRVAGVNGVFGLDVQLQNVVMSEDGRVGFVLTADGSRSGAGTFPVQVIVENTTTGQQAILPLYARLDGE